MPLSPDRSVLFVQVPKVAGTSIAEAAGLGLTPELLHGVEDGWDLQHLSAPELRRRLGEEWDGLFRFAFVRCPWDRVESEYHYLRRMGDAQALRMSFEEFVLDLGRWRASSQRHLVQHFQPQVRFVQDLHFLGRYETLQEDWGLLRMRFPLWRELPRRNASGRGESLHTPRTVELVAQHYAEDVEAFGYEPPAVRTTDRGRQEGVAGTGLR